MNLQFYLLLYINIKYLLNINLQKYIPIDRLKVEWETKFEDLVSHIGFQFTEYSHLSGIFLYLDTLPFIPGMGPIKAKYLLKELKNYQINSNERITRQLLLKKGVLKPFVYDNSSAYIRLEDGHPFDHTRINPDNYGLATSVLYLLIQICASALGKQTGSNISEEDIRKVTKVLWGDKSSLVFINICRKKKVKKFQRDIITQIGIH